MARDKFIMFLQNEIGRYFTAVPIESGGWTVSATPSADPVGDNLFIKHLPIGWDETEITWERNTTYLGVFRSMTNTYKFAADGRAILQSLYAQKNTQAYCKLSIFYLPEIESSPGALDFWEYKLFYESEINFSEYNDDKNMLTLSVSTLDSKLYALLKANANKSYNIPFWTYDSGSGWTTDAEFIRHDGIKLVWQTNYIGGATASNPIAATQNDSLSPAVGHIGDLYGFNHGSRTDGRHWIPALTQYNVVQNNGTTTFIGNDILQPFLLQFNQPYNYNLGFSASVDIQAYSKNQCLIKNLLKNPTETDTVAMYVTVSGTYNTPINYDATSQPDKFIGYVLFEVDSSDEPLTIGGNYQYIMLYQTYLPDGPLGTGVRQVYSPPSMDFSNKALVNLKYDKAYVLGIIYDSPTIGISGSVCNFNLSALSVKIESIYYSGALPSPNAPRFPYSISLAYNLGQALDKVVKAMNSTTTDGYGFPVIPFGTPYNGVSTYLGDTADTRAGNYDVKPLQLRITSENAIKNLKGQTYISLSLAQLFGICFKNLACALGIEGNDIRIEPIEYYLDGATEILNLGDKVANFRIEPLISLKGDNIKAGYSEPSTNNYFGVDSFNIPQEYATALINTPRSIDLAQTDAITDMYTIEKARVQRSDQEQSNPSASNNLILLDASTTTDSNTIEDPQGGLLSVTANYLQVYPTAQSVDPSAATDPYIKGLYYPDTAINTSLTPTSNMMRLGKWLKSLCWGSDTVSFRKQFQMQYNGTIFELPGIQKNISAGLINEVADIDLTSLSPLFRPELFKFTSSYPVNMFELINSNPRGYISFTWTSREGITTNYKGFIWSVSQKMGSNAATDFTLLAHPDTSDADIIAA